MRCYKVSTRTEEQDGQGKLYDLYHCQFGGTQAESKTIRDEFVEELGVKKKDVTIEETEVPTDKTGLLEFLNQLSQPRRVLDGDD